LGNQKKQRPHAKPQRPPRSHRERPIQKWRLRGEDIVFEKLLQQVGRDLRKLIPSRMDVANIFASFAALREAFFQPTVDRHR